jgi:hypothetical protein
MSDLSNPTAFTGNEPVTAKKIVVIGGVLPV